MSKFELWWYYEQTTEGKFVVYDEQDRSIAAYDDEASAFNSVKTHNNEVSTDFERAKLAGRAPGAN